MYNKELNSGVFFRKCVSGNTNQTYNIQYETAELFICNDGTANMSISLTFPTSTETFDVLSGEQIKLPIIVVDTKTGVNMSIVATTAYRVFILGV